MTFEDKAEIVIKQLREDRDRLQNAFEQIRSEIEQTADEEQKHDEKWAIGLRYAIKIIDKYKVENEG